MRALPSALHGQAPLHLCDFLLDQELPTDQMGPGVKQPSQALGFAWKSPFYISGPRVLAVCVLTQLPLSSLPQQSECLSWLSLKQLFRRMRGNPLSPIF